MRLLLRLILTPLVWAAVLICWALYGKAGRDAFVRVTLRGIDKARG